MPQHRFALLHAALLLGLLWSASGPPAQAAAPGADVPRPVPAALATIREQLTRLDSRVVGAPEPPPPYHAVPVYPKLKFDSPMFVVRQPGSTRLVLLDKEGTRLGRTTLDPAAGKFEVLHAFDGVAYSLCFHPDFVTNGRLYVGWNGAKSAAKGKKYCRVTEFRMDPAKKFAFLPASERLIIDWESDGHNGLAVTFGLDRMLYITSGDGTSDSDTNIAGQRLDSLLSKVLRIDVDHAAAGKTYAVPADNPFVGTKGARGETWAYGLRNPWRMATDPFTGHIWVGNNGQDLWEQIFLVRKGDNYGWSVYEGGHPFYLQRKLGPTPHVKPIFDHPHSEARSMTGGIVYTGDRWKELHGAYVYGDYSTGKIWAAKMKQDRLAWHREIADTSLAIAGFGEDAAGELLVVDYHKGVNLYGLRPAPRPSQDATRFPRRLRDTGLFDSVSDHRVHAALIPYSVNAPLWSDGAVKERYIALPVTTADDGKRSVGSIDPGGDMRGWTFPDRTVLVKSFSLEMTEGDPASLRRIETRLLTRQQGEWVGYSYAWNRNQTRAVLVDKHGDDRTYTIRTARGKRRQTWRFPSRTECMVCHSRAAQYVLGTTTVQMNHVHSYGGTSLNQLSVLAALGVLKFDWSAELKARRTRALKADGLSDAEITKQLAEYKPAGKLDGVLAGRLLTRPHLVDPYDARESLDVRARSYLHSNCAQCHVGAGGGNALMNLEFSAKLEATATVDVIPLHDRYGVTDARLLAPGDPDRSILLARIARRGRGQMPQLATSIVDRGAVELLTEWISGMKKRNK